MWHKGANNFSPHSTCSWLHPKLTRDGHDWIKPPVLTTPRAPVLESDWLIGMSIILMWAGLEASWRGVGSLSDCTATKFTVIQKVQRALRCSLIALVTYELHNPIILWGSLHAVGLNVGRDQSSDGKKLPADLCPALRRWNLNFVDES